MLVASDEATAGSVMAKQDLISPFSSGRSHACAHIDSLVTLLRAAHRHLLMKLLSGDEVCA